MGGDGSVVNNTSPQQLKARLQVVLEKETGVFHGLWLKYMYKHASRMDQFITVSYFKVHM